MAGIMLVVMGLTGLGASVRFIPRPVIIGLLQQSRFVEHLGRENIMPNIQAALNRAREVQARMAPAVAS